jgi:D-amino-acid dehydrogenase
MPDVIVVGGGVVGLATAYACVRHGLETALVDRADPGRATDAGAGIISAEADSRREAEWYAFGVRAAAYYGSLLSDLAADGAGETGYDRCGMLLAATGEDEREAFLEAKRRILGRQAAAGAPSADDLREMPPDEARRLFPPFGTVVGAVYYRHAARVDGRLLAKALEQASRRRGLAVRHGSVGEIIIKGGLTEGVSVDGTRYAARRVVIAGGAWSKAFGDQLGIHVPVEPQRGQIIHLKMRNPDAARWPIVSGFRGHYIVPWPDGRVVVGASRETGSGFAPRLTAEGVGAVLAEALRAAPGLADGEIHEMRVGLRPLSADLRPILGPVPRVEGVYLATGHGASGLQLGPYSGKVVADLVAGVEPEVDLTPFSVTRFRERPPRIAARSQDPPDS